MPTSQEELDKKAQELIKLRDKVADAEAKRFSNESELANDVTMKQLEAEEAMLSARLTVAENASKKSAVSDGAAAPLDAVKEQLRLATAQAKAAEKNPSGVARATESTGTGAAGGDSASATSNADDGGK